MVFLPAELKFVVFVIANTEAEKNSHKTNDWSKENKSGIRTNMSLDVRNRIIFAEYFWNSFIDIAKQEELWFSTDSSATELCL